MEFPDLGQHCSEISCKRLDFLPVKCDSCSKIFCSSHMTYAAHNCPVAYKRDNQVPVCPLCNVPVPVDRGTIPDVAISKHIDNNCKSDRLLMNQKVFTNKCSLKGCNVKELVPVVCNDCRKNYCVKHRHSYDHQCTGLRRNEITRGRMSNNDGFASSIHGSLNEDEALARALQLSLNECTSNAARIRNNGYDGFSRNCTLT